MFSVLGSISSGTNVVKDVLIQRYIKVKSKDGGVRRKRIDFTERSDSSFDHSLFSKVLHQHTSHACVRGIRSVLLDYESIAAGDENFEQYLVQLQDVDLRTLSDLERVALFINAYNALCISFIIKHMRKEGSSSITSINDLGNALSPVWKKNVGIVGGKNYSLDQIEHFILRRSFDEPRLHACLVCASLSCPDLRKEAYTADLLDQQMDDQMHTWLSNQAKGYRYMADTDTIRVSKIFLWYKFDFHRDIRSYVAQYLTPDAGDCAKQCKHVRYFEYDWSLNRKKTFTTPLGTGRRAMSWR
jgi:hypothetical protein